MNDKHCPLAVAGGAPLPIALDNSGIICARSVLLGVKRAEMPISVTCSESSSPPSALPLSDAAEG